MHVAFARALVLGMAILFFSPDSASGAEKRPYGAGSYGGPIIDAHNHPRKQSREKLAAHFADVAAAGVEHMVVMRTPNDYRKTKREELLRRAAKHDNVTTLCASDFVGHIYNGYLSRARDIVNAIAENLKAGRCAGVGEVGLRHYDKRWARGGGQHVVTIALDHPLVHEVLAMADAHAVPVVLHIEPVYRPDFIDNVSKVKGWYRRICVKYPKARLIAAHNAMMSTADLAEILLACPNVFADVKILHSKGSIIGFADLHGVNDRDFQFFERWATMIEKFPDRFIYGSDWKEGRRRGYQGKSYKKHLEKVRRMIGSLAPEFQEKFAHSNAKQIFRLP